MPWTIERKHDHVAVVTMNTNKVNAQNPVFFADLHAAFDRLEAEFSDCAVVLGGTGAVFSAGRLRPPLSVVRALLAERDRRVVRGLPHHQSTALHLSAADRGGNQWPCLCRRVDYRAWLRSSHRRGRRSPVLVE